MTQTEPQVMTLKELAAAIPQILFVEQWAAAVRQTIQEALESGAEIEGARLKPKQARRKWCVSDLLVIQGIQAVLNDLGKPSGEDVVAPRVVLTPSVAEKLTGKAQFTKGLSSMTEAESSGWNLELQITQRKQN